LIPILQDAKCICGFTKVNLAGKDYYDILILAFSLSPDKARGGSMFYCYRLFFVL